MKAAIRMVDILSTQLYLNQTMECPLQNMRVLQSIKENLQPATFSSFSLPAQAKQPSKSANKSDPHSPVSLDYTQSFVNQPLQEKYEDTTLQSNHFLITNESVSQLHQSPPSDELCKYLQDEQEEQVQNDYSFEISELKTKLIEIESISQQEIVRLKRELQLERSRNANKASVVSVGVNTDHDHKDDEITILKEMLRQQCSLNKQLLKESIKIRQNVYEGITITKN